MSPRVLFLALAMCALCAASPIGSAEFEDVFSEDALVQTESKAGMGMGMGMGGAVRSQQRRERWDGNGEVRANQHCWNACGGRGGTNCPTRVCGTHHRCCRHWHHDPGCHGIGCMFSHCCARTRL